MECKVTGFMPMYVPPANPQVIFTLRREDYDAFAKIAGKDISEYKLKFWKPRKSKDANSYLWILCDKIAQKINVTKEDVYKKAVREVGVWFDEMRPTSQVKDYSAAWSSFGIAWFVEVLQEYPNGWTAVRSYKGSSLYDQQELSRLIDYVIDEAKALGIETMTPDELAKLDGLSGGGE